MRVGLFVTCLVDLVRPRIGLRALELLEGAGCEVVVPDTQTCCGQPAYNSGDRQAAQALARKVLRELKDCDYVVVPSGSCGGMIKAHYPELLSEFAELRAEVEWLVARTWELTDFLVNVLKLERVPGSFHGTVTYHDSCSGLREMGVKAQPRALLVRGIRARPEGDDHSRAVLWLRRHLRGEVRRHLRAHRRPEVPGHRRHRRRRRGAGRPRLHAQHRGAAAPARRPQDQGACTWPKSWPALPAVRSEE